MKNKYLKILFIIFFLSLFFNLYLSFSSPYLNNDKSYFNLRVIDNIKSTGLPIFYDNLSYGGRYLLIQPLFYYIFTILSFIPLCFKIFPALLISSLVIINYFIAKEITNDERSSLFTALLSGFIPIYSKVLINQFSVYNLVLPLIAFMILCFIKLENKKYLKWFILGSFLLPLVHSSSFLFLFILLFYILLMNAEDLKLTRLKKETLIFSFFLIFLINILFFKKAFLQYGFSVAYGNNPLNYTFDVFQIIYLLTKKQFWGILIGEAQIDMHWHYTSEEVFDSISDASKKYGINSSSISMCCSKNYKFAGIHPSTNMKMIWEYC